MSNVGLSVFSRIGRVVPIFRGPRPSICRDSVVSCVRCSAIDRGSLSAVAWSRNVFGYRNVSSSQTLSASQQAPQKPKPVVKGTRKPSNKPAFRILNATELKDAFGRKVDAKAGNNLIRALQNRRVNGSLIERGVHFEDTTIPEDALKNALQWLRKRYPVDEESAAERWTEKATTQLEREYDSRAQELGLTQGKDEGEQDVYSRPGNRSVLDDMRLHNEKLAKQKERERERSGEAQRSRDLQLAKSTEAERQAKERALERAERRRKMIEESMLFDGPPPKMTLRQRLLSPAVFTAFYTFMMFTYAWKYDPPALEERMWKDLPPTIATLLGLSVTMTLITLAWQIPQFWRVMNTYLLSVPALPEPLSLLGNIFSHSNFTHLTANLSFLWLYGVSLHEEVGRGNFLALFCGGGVVASFASLSWHVLKGNLGATMQGASGGVSAIAFAWVYLNATNPEGPTAASSHFSSFMKVCGYFFVLGQIPLHFIPGYAQKYDVVAHAAGAVAGLIGAAILRVRLNEQRKQNQSEAQEAAKTRPA